MAQTKIEKNKKARDLRSDQESTSIQSDIAAEHVSEQKTFAVERVKTVVVDGIRR